MKKLSLILLAAMTVSGMLSCDHEEITPNDSNTALTPEALAARNNQKTNETGDNNNGSGEEKKEWKIVNSSDERSDDEISVKINAGTVYQTIEGFGASDCWLGEYVGKNYSGKDKMAKLLFSQDTTASGALEGIGLSMWRVNLGAGSAEQGTESGLEDVTRRAECYLKSDGKTYDWTKCKGQQYFMTEAKKYGVEKLLLFSNSPLVFWTKNGKAFSESGDKANLEDDGYEKFAEYMAEVSKHFTESGLPVDYISPVNEPQYNWDGGQEGSGWQNSEITKLVKALDEKLGTQKTEIIIPEAGKWTATYSNTYEGRANQISDFFSDGENSVKNLTHVHKVIAAHSYWEDRNWIDLKNIRTSAYNEAQANGIGLWQTEWSMLDEYGATDDYPGLADAKYIDNALYLSRVIYSDLVWANVSSWSYWTVWGQERWSQKNRFYLIKVGSNVSDNVDLNDEDVSTGGNWADNVNLYVLGNYSRFIRPGYKRVDMTCGNDKSFFGSAFLSGDGNTLVMVYTNLTDSKVRIKPEISGFEGNTKFLRFVTDETKKLERTNMSDGNMVIPAKSVTTVVYCK
ncbi:MAG: beta-glycosidase [Bacteroidales bacterium]|nr:beta-glycosidase [Bacteroidales bacterium]